MPSLTHSLGYNELCGIDAKRRGKYTAEGITAICEMLKVNTTLQSIEYVARV